MKYVDESISVPELARRTKLRLETLYEFTRMKDNPLPNIMIGSHKRVHWSDWLEWSTKRLGVDGDLRGKAQYEKDE